MSSPRNRILELLAEARRPLSAAVIGRICSVGSWRLNRTLYRLAMWASLHRVDWLTDLIYRYRCPSPIDGVCSPRACFQRGQCGCDNAKRFTIPALAPIQKAMKSEKAEGDDEPCFYCSEPCDPYAGDPGRWPVGFAQADGTGICRWHHARCVVDRLPPAPVPNERKK